MALVVLARKGKKRRYANLFFYFLYFDYNKETPQIQRAKENGFSIVRPYCAGWMFPLYFQGHSQIVDATGKVVAASLTKNKTEVLIAELVR